MLLLGWLFCTHASFAECTADRIDERAAVGYVYDGDTLRLEDGRWIRLIGIDTPELAHRDKRPAAEPYAVEARDALRHLIGRGDSIGLRFDAERFDRHGRTLAHVYTTSGTNVQAWLLGSGYARALRVPPNLLQVECYRAAEGQARAQPIGIWRLPNHQPIDVAKLSRAAAGFHIIQGRVERVRESRRAIRLELHGGVELRIDRDDLVYFAGLSPRDLAGHTVTVRGWLSHRDHHAGMQLRHGADIERIDGVLPAGLQGWYRSSTIDYHAGSRPGEIAVSS